MSIEHNLYKKQPKYNIKNIFKTIIQIVGLVVVTVIVCIIGIYCAEIIQNTSPNINLLELMF